MNDNLDRMQKAIRALHYTTPLDRQDPRYVERPDGLAQKLQTRLTAPTAPRLLVSGPAGCGKSTELLRLVDPETSQYTPVHCPCDRDLDLYSIERQSLLRYLIWRIIYYSLEQKLPPISKQIIHDSLICIGIANSNLMQISPRLFFAAGRPTKQEYEINDPFSSKTIKSNDVPISDEFILATFHRLISEYRRPILLLIDGLEKVPGGRFSEVVRDFIRMPLLDEFQSIIVVPGWALHGWDSISTYPNVEVLDIPIMEHLSFVEKVILVRAPIIFTESAITEAARLSGGVVRDGLQIATNACRAAMDDNSIYVDINYVLLAKRDIARSYTSMFSDNPMRVGHFLRHIRDTGQLPGNAELRDRLLASGAVLPKRDGSFCVHPILSDPNIEDVSLTKK